MTTSIVVVGGGLVGAATAYFAAREGADVTLLEQQTRAYGASGRNPGFVWLHCREPGWALETSLAGRALYDELAQDLPVPFEFRAEGGLIYFTDERQLPVFEQFIAARREDGLDMELLDGGQVRDLVRPIRPDVLGASFCHNDAQINTPTVVSALVEGAVAEGATVLEGVTVQRLVRSADGSGTVVGVDTDRGRFLADKVVMASGAWSEKLLAQSELEVQIGRERLQVIALTPQPAQIKPLVYGPLVTKHYRLFRNLPAWDPELFVSAAEKATGMDMLTLASQRENGEILLGCPMDYPADVDMTTTVTGLRMIMEYVEQDFPSLANAAVDRTWAGILPFTSDTLPIVGEVQPGVYVAAGHIFGNAAGPMTGKLVAQMVLGQTPEIDMTPVRHDRPLDPIQPGEKLAY